METGNPEPLVADPGPPFDPSRPPEPDELGATPEPEPAAGALVAWDDATLRAALTTQGRALHGVAGKGETDWIYTEQELDAIAPHLARILNRYDTTRAIAGSADELAVMLGLAGYTMRSVQDRQRAIAAANGRAPEPARARPQEPPPSPPAGEPSHTAGPPSDFETPDMSE